MCCSPPPGPAGRRPPGAETHEAQVNPPLPHDDEFGAPHGIGPAPPDEATALAKVESCLATWFPPQAGQTTSLASAPTRWSTSKRFPQPPHRYSYSGITAPHNPSRNGPTLRSAPRRERRHRSCGSIRSSGTARAGILTWARAGAPCRRPDSARREPSPVPRRWSLASRLASRPRRRIAGPRVLVIPLEGRAGSAATRIAAPTTGRVGDGSRRDAEPRQHHPLQHDPRREHAQQRQGAPPVAHRPPPRIAARPRSSWSFSA